RIFATSQPGSGMKGRKGSATRPVAAAIQPIIMSRSAPVLTRAFQLAWSRAEARTARVTVRVKVRPSKGGFRQGPRNGGGGKLAVYAAEAERAFWRNGLR